MLRCPRGECSRLDVRRFGFRAKEEEEGVINEQSLEQQLVFVVTLTSLCRLVHINRRNHALLK